MTLLLNELSFHNQFKSFEEFQLGALKDLIRFLNLQKLGKIELLKKSDIYSQEIYNGITLYAILTSKNNDGKSDEIRKLKSQLASVIENPFWDSERKCLADDKYSLLDEDVSESSLAEAYERDCSLMSLNPSKFVQNKFQVTKSKISKTLCNYTSFNVLIAELYKKDVIDFCFFCKHYYKDSNLNFSAISDDSFKKIKKKDDALEFLNSFNMFNSMTWNDILQQGGKGKNKVGLAYSKYHNQDYFKNYAYVGEIYKFRSTQKFRVYGYRVLDTFYVIEFDLTHELSD